MSDDLNKKIKQITDILGQENIPDNIKGLLSLLAGPGTADREEPVQGPVEVPAPKEEKVVRSAPDDNMDAVRKIKKVMDRFRAADDPRINLLAAVRPFLNNKRQKKLDSCIKLLQVSSLAKFIDDNDK